MKFLTIIIGIILIISINSITNISFAIEGKEKFCFHDYYSDQTLVTYIIYSDKLNAMNVLIRNPDSKKVIETNSTNSFKDSFTTFGGGYYEICILNTLAESINIDFECKSGIAAKDYSQIPTLKDLQPIEKDLLKLEEKSKELYHLISYAESHEKVYGDLQQGIVFNVSLVSIVVVAIILVIGGVEAFISRRIILNRKLK